MTTEEPGSLPTQVQEFADDLGTLLRGVFLHVPNIEVTDRSPRFLVQPEGQETHAGGVPLTIGGEELAWLRLSYRCRIDSRNQWMAVSSSEEWVVAQVDRTPILRFDFRRDASWEPCSHIQVHAHRGAMSHLLSQANRPNPHDMSEVRLPTGGARMRPCLADIIQMLVTQMGFDAVEDWEAAVLTSRIGYRSIQIKALARAQPELVAVALERLGYVVTRPPEGVPVGAAKALRIW